MFALALGSSAAGHDIGVLTVDLHLRDDRRYEVVVTVDAEHAASTPELAPLMRGDDTQPSIVSFSHALAARLSEECRVLIDGEEFTLPMLTDARVRMPGDDGPGKPSSPRVALRFSGSATLSARLMAFRCELNIGEYLVRTHHGDGEPVGHWEKTGRATTPAPFDLPATNTLLSEDPDREPPAPSPELAGTVAEYVRLGFEHILPKGLDHILFVIALFLAGTGTRSLLMQVTAFTLAHTLTLALAATGVVRISPAIVEPLIALSIVLVAAENAASGSVGWRRAGMVFAFGLLHGLGFAGVLGELGLPRGQALGALVGFNVGVELGQLAVIGLAFLAVGWWRSRAWYRARVVIPASAAIACVGMFWCVQRVGG